MRIAAYRTILVGLALAAIVVVGAPVVFMADQHVRYDAGALLLELPAPSPDPLASAAHVQGDVTVLPATLEIIARWLLAFAGAAAVLAMLGIAGLFLVECVIGEAAPAAEPAAAQEIARSAAPACPRYRSIDRTRAGVAAWWRGGRRRRSPSGFM